MCELVPVVSNLAIRVRSGDTGTDRLVSIENVTGSQGANSLIGDDNAYVINGLGGGGNDRLIGGDGDDVLNRGNGNDWLYGGAGNDTFADNAGDEVFEGGLGNDTYTTAIGNDRIVLRPGFGNDSVYRIDADAAGGQDTVDLTEFGISTADFAQRVAVMDQGHDALVIIDGDPHQTLKLVGGANHLTITQSDFILFTT